MKVLHIIATATVFLLFLLVIILLRSEREGKEMSGEVVLREGRVVKEEEEEKTIGVISDTHIPTRAEKVPDNVFKVFQSENVSMIIHGGDITEYPVIRELEEKVAPVVAVSGNVDNEDIRNMYKDTEVLDIRGVRVGVIHGTPLIFKMRKLKRIARENELDVLVSGHTHRPFVKVEDNVLYINPGSPTQPFLSKPTVGLLKFKGNKVSAEIIPV